MIKRYNRAPNSREIDKIRVALKNKTCFLWRDSGSKIEGIVRFRNIYITAIYNKGFDGVVTAGRPILT